MGVCVFFVVCVRECVLVLFMFTWLEWFVWLAPHLEKDLKVASEIALALVSVCVCMGMLPHTTFTLTNRV